MKKLVFMSLIEGFCSVVADSNTKGSPLDSGFCSTAVKGLEAEASADDFCCWGDDWSNEEGFCTVVGASNTKEAPLDSGFS